VAGGESEKSCRCVPVTLDGPRSRPHMFEYRGRGERMVDGISSSDDIS